MVPMLFRVSHGHLSSGAPGQLIGDAAALSLLVGDALLMSSRSTIIFQCSPVNGEPQIAQGGTVIYELWIKPGHFEARRTAFPG